MKGYSGVYAHLGYAEVKTYTFESYQRLIKEEEDFLKKLKWHRIPKEVSEFDLITAHPYWRRYARKENRKYYYQVCEWVNECIKDEEQIKYKFNKYETIESLKNKLKEQRIRIYKS